MSQFILFKNRIETEEFSKIEDPFLKKYANIFFNTSSDIFTINHFDDICTFSQKQINDGISIYDTKLYDLLIRLKNDELYFWYASYFDDLDLITNFTDLINSIEEALINFNAEVYIHYRPENIKSF